MVLYLGFWVSNRNFCQWQDWNSSKITLCGESTRLREVNSFHAMSSFSALSHDEPYHLLDTCAFQCIRIFFKILCFSCQGKSRDIVYQRICLFLWSLFARHGLFEIQLTVYSALSRLTDLGIYDITRCGIWLLTIFHIPYIHYQRELRMVTSPKWYLSFFVQYTCLYRFHKKFRGEFRILEYFCLLSYVSDTWRTKPVLWRYVYNDEIDAVEHKNRIRRPAFGRIFHGHGEDRESWTRGMTC